jgi:cytochrome P450
MSDLPPLVMPEINFGTDPQEDMASCLLELEKLGEPVVRIRYKDEIGWLVLGHDNISEILRDDVRIPAATHFKVELDTLGHTLFHMEGAEHRTYKNAFNKRFSPSAVRQFAEGRLVGIIDGLIDDFGDVRELELNHAFSRRLGFAVVSALLGVPVPPESEEEVMEMITGLNQLLDQKSTIEQRREISRRAVERANRYLQPVLAERRRERRDDLISYFVDLEIDGRLMGDEEILDHIRGIYQAGADSTGLTLGNVMNEILARPGLYDRLMSDRHVRRPIIEELTRLQGITGLLTRRTNADTPFRNRMIPRGALILLGVPGANRDPVHFPMPETLALDRPPRNMTFTFGAGMHFCLGFHLAREEIRISVDRLLDRLVNLRLATPPYRPAGNLFRFVQQGVHIRFDELLPAAMVPTPAG